MTLKEGPFRSISTQADGWTHGIPLMPEVQWEKFANKIDLTAFNGSVRDVKGRRIMKSQRQNSPHVCILKTGMVKSPALEGWPSG
jgi:hypothetical protein